MIIIKVEIRTAIISSLITAVFSAIASIIVFLLGDFSSQKTIEKNTVETLTEYFDSVNENMSYKESLQIIYEETKNKDKEIKQLKSENEKLTKQSNDYEKKIDSAGTEHNQSIIEASISYAEAGDYEKAILMLEDIDKKNSQIESYIDEFKKKYENDIIEKAIILQNEEAYEEAIKLIEEALNVLTNNSILETKRAEIDNLCPKNFVEVCEPYEVSYHYNKFINGGTFLMSGQERTNGFTIMAYDNIVISNLDGKYSELNFDIGHIDESRMNDATLSIYLDGNIYKSYDVIADALPISVVVTVQNVKQIKFLFHGSSTANNSPTIGIADMKIR